MSTTSGLTWHASVVDPAAMAAMSALLKQAFGIQPAIAMDGFAQYQFENGTMLELNDPRIIPPYGYNGEGVAFGFRVDDIEESSRALHLAGAELLGDIVRLADFDYAYRHFRGPDGRVYGINEVKPQPR